MSADAFPTFRAAARAWARGEAGAAARALDGAGGALAEAARRFLGRRESARGAPDPYAGPGAFLAYRAARDTPQVKAMAVAAVAEALAGAGRVLDAWRDALSAAGYDRIEVVGRAEHGWSTALALRASPGS